MAHLFLVHTFATNAADLPVFEDQQFKPQEIGHYSEFGRAVAVDGGTAIITAPQWTVDGLGYGRAFVYERAENLDPWNQVSELFPNDAAVDQHFGASVDIDGNLAVVGAWGDSANGFYSGAAYVFERNLAGVWEQAAKLQASAGGPVEYFGSAVAISGNQILVGAHGSGGAAYIFSRDSFGSWLEVEKLTSPEPSIGEVFGGVLDMAGDRVVVAASSLNGGAAYVFEKGPGDDWKYAAKLSDEGGGQFDQFGYSVSIHSNTIAVGAPTTRSGNDYNGTVYIFKLDEQNRWGVTHKIESGVTPLNLGFGSSLSIAENYLLIGAPNQEIDANLSGVGYLFKSTMGSQWTLKQTLVGEGSVRGEFGNAVAVGDGAAFVGAWRVDFDSGLAYAYNLAVIPEPSTLFLAWIGLAFSTSRLGLGLVNRNSWTRR